MRAAVDALKPAITKAVDFYVKNPTPIVHDRARLLAAKAIASFDPTRGADIKTHVQRQLQALQGMQTKLTSPFAPPQQLVQERGQVYATTQRLRDDLGRDPTDEEIIEATGIKKKRFNKIRDFLHAQVPLAIAEQSEDEEDPVPDIAMGARTEYDDWMDAVYHGLSPTDKLIFQYRSGYRGASKLGASEIAKRVNLPVSTVHSRIQVLQKRLNEFQ